MHNEGWIPDYSGGRCSYPPMPNGKYGHRGLQTTEDFARPTQDVLVEDNRFGFSSANPNNPGDANYVISSPTTIVRYNYSFGGHQSGIGTKYAAYPAQADALASRGRGGTGPLKVRIYNNTTFWNGHTYPYMKSAQPGCSTCPGKLAGINVDSGRGMLSSRTTLLTTTTQTRCTAPISRLTPEGTRTTTRALSPASETGRRRTAIRSSRILIFETQPASVSLT